MFKFTCGATLALFLAAPASAEVDLKQFEGLWAISYNDCHDPDGPNYKTYIKGDDFDQYENHCKILKVNKTEGSLTLEMTCDAEGETVHETVKLSPMKAGKMMLDRGNSEQLYERCNFKPDEANATPQPTEIPKCSDPEVVDLVKSSALKSPQIQSDQLIIQVGFNTKLSGVVTEGPLPNGKGFMCSARISLVLKPSEKKDRMNSVFKAMGSGAIQGVEGPVRYRVQLSDDGKEILTNTWVGNMSPTY